MRNHTKINNNKWIPLATFVWEQKYGKLKNGDVIHHINGNTLDDNINNLIAIPRKDHPTYHNKYGLSKIPNEKLEYYINRYLNKG